MKLQSYRNYRARSKRLARVHRVRLPDEQEHPIPVRAHHRAVAVPSTPGRATEASPAGLRCGRGTLSYCVIRTAAGMGLAWTRPATISRDAPENLFRQNSHSGPDGNISSPVSQQDYSRQHQAESPHTALHRLTGRMLAADASAPMWTAWAGERVNAVNRPVGILFCAERPPAFGGGYLDQLHRLPGSEVERSKHEKQGDRDDGG